MTDFIIAAEDREMTFSGENGAVTSFVFNEKELVVKSKELFTLYFRDRSKERKLFPLLGSAFADFSRKENNLIFSGNPAYPSLRVEIAIRIEDGFFYFRPSVTGIPREITLERIDAPQITVSNEGQVLWPYSEGVLVNNAARFDFLPATFPDKFYCGYYPGFCQMQFLAHYFQGTGIYFAAHDPGHTTKTVGFGNDGNGNVQLHLETFCDASDCSEYRSGFDYVVGVFQGDWMDAAAIYRNWIINSMETPQQPEWISDSPVVVIYPVRGNGKITDEPNEYFPYENAMPYIRKLAEGFDSRILSHLMRWDGHAPWAPPYAWPPMGGIDSLLKFRDLLHGEGHLLGLYGSGTYWTLKSKINDYSTEKYFSREKLDRFMTRGPNGEIEAEICNGIRKGCGMCITEEWCRQIFKEQVSAMASAGVDFIQLLDQNLGGAALLCYSEEHSHPPAPGRWQTEAMSGLLQEISGKLETCILGTECAAAEPYIKFLQLNDSRPVFTYRFGMPVPVYQFVYHRYCSNFMGNQTDASRLIKCHECPENLLWRIAYAFNAGDLLSVTLRDRGIIDWGAAADWNSPPPDQETTVTLIRNLNHVRKRYPEFLLKGIMIKPFINVEGSKYVLRLADRDEVIDSFTQSAWESLDGRRAQFITNFLPKTQKLSCRLPQGMCVYIDHEAKEDDFELNIPPLTSIIAIIK